MDAVAVYADVTAGLTRPVRAEELVYPAPGLPSRDAIAAERAKLRKDKAGLEIAQGAFLGDVLADPECGRHLIDTMLRPTPLALEHRAAFARDRRRAPRARVRRAARQRRRRRAARAAGGVAGGSSR